MTACYFRIWFAVIHLWIQQTKHLQCSAVAILLAYAGFSKILLCIMIMNHEGPQQEVIQMDIVLPLFDKKK